MDGIHDLFIPPYLQQLGYGSISCMIELGKKAISVKETHIETNPFWEEWRGIFEYICCVEYAYNAIFQLPKGIAIGSIDVVPSKYHSASMVFYSEAILDNISFWLKNKFNLQIQRTNCSLHKVEFQEQLISKNEKFNIIFDEHKSYLTLLNKYRNEWVHRLAGGAFVSSDKPPSDPHANIQIVVPIDPKVNIFNTNSKEYLRRIEECKLNNNGKWLYTIDEFANIIRDGVKQLTIDILEVTLEIFKDK